MTPKKYATSIHDYITKNFRKPKGNETKVQVGNEIWKKAKKDGLLWEKSSVINAYYTIYGQMAPALGAPARKSTTVPPVPAPIANNDVATKMAIYQEIDALLTARDYLTILIQERVNLVREL